MQQRVKAAAAAGLLALAAACAACGDGAPAAVIQTTHGPVRVALEVAATPEAQRQGLMYRTSLPDDHGMLFLFPADADHEFWMKNTLIPLDMLFITADGRIAGIRENTTPLSTVPLGIGRPSRHVLEVPGGYAARRGIAAGNRVELHGVPVP